MQKKLNIILATGGTGGHVFPARSLCAELARRGHKVAYITDERGMGYGIGENKTPAYIIDSASVSGGLTKKIKAVGTIIKGVPQAIRILKKEKADIVVGFGGYPSFPAMLAAKFLGLKTVIHEQNAIAGKVNRVLAGSVNAICSTFPEPERIKGKDFAKLVVTGNPVREDIIKLREKPYMPVKKNGKLNILITGGSQGARVFSDIIPKAIASLPEKTRKKLKISQQCREEDVEEVTKIYENCGIKADTATFFGDIPKRLAEAHLVICRSGASTVAELTVAGRPAILVPYKYASDDHQKANAMALSKKGAAFFVEQDILSQEVISAFIGDFFENPEILSQTAMNAFDMGIADATQKMADVVERL